MAYNNYFGGYPASYQQYQAPNYQMTAQPQPMQIQNGGFVSVRSAREAFDYPVALGNSVTFKDETAPYIYVKTRGFSQLEEPVFEQFQLVKVNAAKKSSETPVQAVKTPGDKIIEYALKSDTAALWSEIEAIKTKLSGLNTTEGIKDE